jgi:diguanylate cyclase (GGDEF)-like protein/PAS domain S-box-containing protein
MRLILLIFLLCASVSSWAQNQVPNTKLDAFFDEVINLNSVAEFHITSKGLLLSDVQQLTSWQGHTQFISIADESALWVRFQIENNASTNKMLTLSAGSVYVDRVDVFLLDEQGRITQSARSLDQQNNADKISRRSFTLDILSRAESNYTVYIRVEDDGHTILPLRLWQTDVYNQKTSIRLILLGAMSGGLALLATYFLLTYILRSTPARFWFCLFAVGGMTTMLSAEGILPVLFFIPSFTAELTGLSLVVTLFAAIKITRIIIQPMSVYWLRAHYVLLCIPLIGVFVLNDFMQLIILIAFSLLFFASKLIATIVYRKGVDLRSAAIYFLGWIILGCVGFFEFVNFLNSTGFHAYSAPFPFVFTCMGIMLIGVAIISREQSLQTNQIIQQSEQIDELQKFNDLFKHAAEGLYTATPNGELIHVNPAICSLFGFEDSASFIAAKPSLHDFFTDPKEADLLLGELSIQQTVLGKEVKGKRIDDSEFWFSISCQLQNVNNEKLHFGSLFDITERRLHQINLQYLNTHDQLTGLFNRRHFIQLMNERISNQTESSSKFALLFLDVDQFKVINDTCGHSAGDIFIKELSHELFDIVSDKYPFARLSADQFALLVDFETSNELRSLAEEILTKVRSFDFKWDRHIFSQSMSMGIAAYDATIPSGEELLSFADTACLIAKESGRDKIHMYSAEIGMHSNYKRDLFWVNEVKNAIKEETLELFYQHYRPLNTTDDKQYYEILVRLRTRDDDLVAPEFFMPSAEKAAISHKIDKQVVESYFVWLQQNPSHLEKLSKANINLSGLSLSDEDFQYFLLNAFEKYQVPFEKICFEITETMAIIKMNDAVEFMKKFKKLGCTFALDDFGSGFSSYSYLKYLPVDFVKIDGNFIRDILKDPIDLAMVTSIRDVAEAMKIKTVAEFVETPEIMVQIGKLGVDFAQGYCIAEPEPLRLYKDYAL